MFDVLRAAQVESEEYLYMLMDDALGGDWETSLAVVEGFALLPSDFPLYDESADDMLPSVEDWEAFAEDTFTEFPRF